MSSSFTMFHHFCVVFLFHARHFTSMYPLCSTQDNFSKLTDVAKDSSGKIHQCCCLAAAMTLWLIKSTLVIYQHRLQINFLFQPSPLVLRKSLPSTTVLTLSATNTAGAACTAKCHSLLCICIGCWWIIVWILVCWSNKTSPLGFHN